METKALTPQFLLKRKFFLVLPLLVLPFVTLLFWALGGGKGGDLQAQEQTAKGGLNAALPDAYLKDDQSLNKLSYYEKAASDSARLEELLKSDPYYLQHRGGRTEGILSGSDSVRPFNNQKQDLSGRSSSLNTSPYSSHDYADPNEAKVYKKLEALNTALNGANVRSEKVITNQDLANRGNSMSGTDIDRLEQMMERTKNGDGSEDPEMKQLNSMIEKILDIQHPERMKEKLKQTTDAHKGQVFAVTAEVDNQYSSLLENSEGAILNNYNVKYRQSSSYNSFHSLEDDITNITDQQNAIQAVIHETQTVTEGTTVKLRLQNDIYINGVLVPKGGFVFGTATLSGERLNIRIGSVRYRNALFPVQLSVYDLDGMEGIYIPGAITRDVAKNSADRSLQGININTLDPSLGAQAASAGIEATKTLLSRKVKLVKVMVKAGYQVLLKDDGQKASS